MSAKGRPGDQISGLRLGEPFNPYKRFNGSFIPEHISRYRGLSPGAKLIYGRLYRYAGADGAAFPGVPTLARETGLGDTQARKYIRELEVKRFIAVDRDNRHYREDGSGGSNGYIFLWHEAFQGNSGELRKAPPPLRKTEGVPPRKTERLTPAENRTRRESTALRESIKESQLISRAPSAFDVASVNEVNAPAKLTSPAESQKARFAPEASGCGCPAADETPTPEDKADCAAKAAALENQNLPDRERQEQHPVKWKEWTGPELAAVRERIVAFWGREPEQGFEESVMLRSRCAPAAGVIELLDRKWKRTQLRPGGRHAPRSQNWFLALVEEEFEPGHMPEIAAMESGGNPVWNGRGERRATLGDELGAGIAAIELPDAPADVLVESCQCKCGVTIRRYRNRGVVGECLCGKPSREGFANLEAWAIGGVL